MPKPTQKTADMASQIEDEMDVLDRIKQNRFGSDERDYSWNGVDPVHDLEAFMELIEQSEFPRKRIPLSFEDGSKEKFVLPRDPKEYEEGVRELRTKFGYMGKNEIFNDVEIIDITDPFIQEEGREYHRDEKDGEYRNGIDDDVRYHPEASGNRSHQYVRSFNSV